MFLSNSVGFLLFFAFFWGFTHSNPNDLKSESRIFGGIQAEKNQFPFVVYIDVSKSIPGFPTLCGGSLISPSFVLTSAYCIRSATWALVKLGTNNVSDPLFSIVTDSFRIHPNYDVTTSNNDIGLINLLQELPLSDSLKTVCIARRSLTSENFVDQIATVLGFGYVANGAVPGNQLRYANVPVITHERCKQDYNEGVIIETSLCCRFIQYPESSARNTCFGDDGGPLIIFDETENNYVQIGVANAVAFGCSPGYPSLYTQPHHYWGWISGVAGIPIKE